MANPVKPFVASNTPPTGSPLTDGQGKVTPEWLRVFQDAAGFISYQTLWANVTPAGTTQATAPELSTRNVYLSAAAAHGVRLPRLPYPGQRVIVFNASGNAQNIYPGVGGQIDAAGLNTAVSLASGAHKEYLAYTAKQWFSV